MKNTFKNQRFYHNLEGFSVRSYYENSLKDSYPQSQWVYDIRYYPNILSAGTMKLCPLESSHGHRVDSFHLEAYF